MKMIPIPSFLLGFFSIISQVLLVRELIAVFYGNEMAYAVILAGWLFWIAVGSYGASLITAHIKDPFGLIGTLQTVLALFLPITIIMARHIKLLLGLQTGEIISVLTMSVASGLLVAPLAIVVGGLFTIICLMSDREGGGKDAVLRVGGIYLWESIGAAVGGLTFGFLFIRVLPALPAAFLLGGVYLAVAAWLMNRRGYPFWGQTCLAVGIFAVFVFGGIHRVDDWTRQRQWEGFKVVASADSIYGNIALIRIGEDYSLYENGLLSFSTKDDLTSEESVHFPLLAHSDPLKVLLIGNGLGGSLREILKHPVSHVDYVELDPAIMEVAQRHLPAVYFEPFEDARTRVIHADARWMVKHARETYDVVLVNLGDPYTALVNRYYSLEFFREVRAALNPSGILALRVSSSENYLSAEARAFLRSIQTTLSKVFPDVRSVPGDTNVFLACAAPGVLTDDAEVLVRRLKARGIDNQFINEYYLPSRMSPDRMAYIKDALQGEGLVNTDAHPSVYLYDIILWSTHFNMSFKNLVSRLQNLPFAALMGLPFLILMGGWIRSRRSPLVPVTLSILTTGFCEIIFQIVVILAFQAIYGYAYYKIGLIMASFMAGLCWGTAAARHVIYLHPGKIPRLYKAAQLAIVIYPLVLPVAFIVFRDFLAVEGLGRLFPFLFAMLPLVAGLIGGFQYPLATHLIHSVQGGRGEGAARPAGWLYAVDVFGACVGALVTGMFLVPLFGIHAVVYLCAAMNAAVFLLLYPAQWRPSE